MASRIKSRNNKPNNWQIRSKTFIMIKSSAVQRSAAGYIQYTCYPIRPYSGRAVSNRRTADRQSASATSSKEKKSTSTNPTCIQFKRLRKRQCLKSAMYQEKTTPVQKRSKLPAHPPNRPAVCPNLSTHSLVLPSSLHQKEQWQCDKENKK